jgi:hypothetical protein
LRNSGAEVTLAGCFTAGEAVAVAIERENCRNQPVTGRRISEIMM